MTAGTWWARRSRRAAPLPNSVRFVAVILISDTSSLLGSGADDAGNLRNLGPDARATDRPDYGARVAHGGAQRPRTASITAPLEQRPSPRQPRHPSRVDTP